VYFPNVNIGYAVGIGGTIIKSNDMGSSWIEQKSGFENGLYSLFFNNFEMGFAVGENGIILKTETGGQKPYININIEYDN
jgi:photosystem II stability/assembly factor-like uncharacterized protein